MTPSGIARRRFFVGAAGAGAALGLGGGGAAAQPARGAGGLPDYVAWKDAEDLIVHTPRTIEMKRSAFGSSGITPDTDLFVRNNLPPPDARILEDRDGWEVSVEGVRNPRRVALRELKAMGVESVAAVLQCSGNGRAFFDHKASGTQWRVGAAGNVMWSGVPLRAVAEAMGGVADGMRFITARGGEDIPQGIDPRTVMVERSVPIAAMDRALLAWELNDDPVPLAHGGPLRLVLPGFFGVNNVKYVKRLAFTAEESDAAIQRTGYRVRPVGQRGAPSQPSMWEMTVKSWVTQPLRETADGPVQILGVAFGGARPLRRVEVSTDGGSNWQEARLLGPDLGRYAWRPFALAAELSPGTHLVASRATDEEGNSQPEKMEPNERGYGHNGWRDHAVEITVR
ncbi:sulfite oxidase [Falsiroseomonas bella]|uniref:Sulfite oxidase n=1 Tax=Falsiroseomonas bella TaxID=2184016 RepID=A0A317FHQ8_9PROT|nr:sulfite oxidase [Falsiroseomonas bella]PWS38540.1 sulfite oxidase [Falsiroseomonas bella]